MNYEHFGAFLQDLRIRHNFSREKLAENICTAKQIYRIEKGESEPSLYLITQLSIKFNMDLHDYYKMYFTRSTITGLEGIKTLNKVIESGNMVELKSLIESYEQLEDFKKGENLQHIYYGKALCSALLNNDYKNSLDYSLRGIHIEDPNFNINTISQNMYSNVGIVLLNCISQNYFALNQYNYGMKVLTELLTILDNYVINSPYPLFQAPQFSKKIYQSVLYNIGIHLFNNGEINKSIIYVDKGIEFSLKENNLRLLPELITLKFQILYYQKHYDDALEYYNQAKYLYKITNKENKLADLVKDSKSKYPQIFKK